jgi:hypothetical protein
MWPPTLTPLAARRGRPDPNTEVLPVLLGSATRVFAIRDQRRESRGGGAGSSTPPDGGCDGVADHANIRGERKDGANGARSSAAGEHPSPLSWPLKVLAIRNGGGACRSSTEPLTKCGGWLPATSSSGVVPYASGGAVRNEGRTGSGSGGFRLNGGAAAPERANEPACLRAVE